LLTVDNWLAAGVGFGDFEMFLSQHRVTMFLNQLFHERMRIFKSALDIFKASKVEAQFYLHLCHAYDVAYDAFIRQLTPALR